jgi:Outer membrane protein beta-barrel domain
MQRIYILVFFMFTGLFAHAQILEPVKQDTITIEKDSVAPFADPYYREDQFYATINYNLILGKPETTEAQYSQYSFSTGIGVGFLRDMPLNKRRNHSIALGLGYAYDNIKHNLAVTQDGAKNSYSIVSESDFKKNKLVLHYLDIPLEFRWRTSDSISHQFWRVYLGVKASYLLYDKAQYEPNGAAKVKITGDGNINRWQYGAYVSAGWNTWNFYAYYGFTPLYESAYLGNEKLKIYPIKLGLIFYIL